MDRINEKEIVQTLKGIVLFECEYCGRLQELDLGMLGEAEPSLCQECGKRKFRIVERHSIKTTTTIIKYSIESNEVKEIPEKALIWTKKEKSERVYNTSNEKSRKSQLEGIKINRKILDLANG